MTTDERLATIESTLNNVNLAVTNHVTAVQRQLSAYEVKLDKLDASMSAFKEILAPWQFVGRNGKALIAIITGILALLGYKVW